MLNQIEVIEADPIFPCFVMVFFLQNWENHIICVKFESRAKIFPFLNRFSSRSWYLSTKIKFINIVSRISIDLFQIIYSNN